MNRNIKREREREKEREDVVIFLPWKKAAPAEEPCTMRLPFVLF